MNDLELTTEAVETDLPVCIDESNPTSSINELGMTVASTVISSCIMLGIGIGISYATEKLATRLHERRVKTLLNSQPEEEK